MEKINKKEFHAFTFVDLFAGIGGFHTAMHSVGAHCVFASEWDKYARISYEANYKDIEPNLFKKDSLGNYKYFNEWRVFFTMNNTTYSAKKSEIESKWYIIDAQGKSLGRVATEAAKLLRGKHKPTFTPNIDTGDHVIVLNCKEAVLTGRKLDQKVYRHHSGYIGGMKETSARVMMENKPEQAMMLAVKGMLPHNSLGRQMVKKLRVYAGSEHENIAQKPEVWEVK